MAEAEDVHSAGAVEVEHLPVNVAVVVLGAGVGDDDLVKLQACSQVRGGTNDTAAAGIEQVVTVFKFFMQSVGLRLGLANDPEKFAAEVGKGGDPFAMSWTSAFSSVQAWTSGSRP